MPTSLEIHDLELWVYLGVPEAERAERQRVCLDLQFELAAQNAALHEDDYAQALCYGTLMQQLQRFCEGRQFQLIEYLATQLHQHIRAQYPQFTLRDLCLKKNPPMAQIRQAAIRIRD